MSKMKKLLSIVLCLTMLVGTIALGLSVNAADDPNVKSYETLTTENASKKFAYSALRFYDEEGNLLENEAVISSGATLYCDVYMKTNQALYKGSQLSFYVDGALFSTGGITKESGANISKINCKEITAADNEDEYNAVKNTVVSAPSTDSIIRVTLTFAYNNKSPYKCKDKFNVDTAVARLKLVTNTDVEVEEVKTAVTCGTAALITDGSGILVSNQGTDSSNLSESTRFYIGGSTSAKAITALDTLEFDGNYKFTVNTGYTVKFVDGETTVSEETYPIPEDGASYSEVVVPSNDSVENFFCWVTDKGIVADFTNDTYKFAKAKVTYYAVKTTDKVDVKFSYSGATLDDTADYCTKSVPVTGFELSDYVPVKDGAEFDTWTASSGSTIADGKATFSEYGSAVTKRTFTATWKNVVIFKSGNDDFDKQFVSANGYPTKVDTSTISGFVGWADKEGNIVDPTTVAITEDTTYTAVLDTDTVDIKLSFEGATLGETENEKTITVSAAGFNAADYTPVKGSYKFGGWKDANGTKYTDKVALSSINDGQVFTASWKGDVTIKVRNIDTLEWVDGFTYSGEYGEAITAEDILNIQKEANDKADDLEKIIGADTYGFDIAFSDGNNAGDIDTTTVTDSYFKIASDGSTPVGLLNTMYKNYKFGVTDMTIYLNTAVKYDISVYTPVLDENNDPVKDEEAKYGFKWNETKTSVGYQAFNEYKNGNSSFTSDDVAIKDVKTLFDSSKVDEIKYALSYCDANGKFYDVSKVGQNSNINITKKNFDEGSTTKASVYVLLNDVEFYVGLINSDNKRFVSTEPVSIGDEISIDTIQKLVRDSNLGKASQVFDIDELKIDGERLEKKGYTLSKVTYTVKTTDEQSGETTTIIYDLTNGDSFEFTRDIAKTAYYDNYTGISSVMLECEWEAKKYDFNLYYQNADSEWSLVMSKTFEGNKTVSYLDFIASGSEVETKVTNDVPSDVRLLKNAVSKDKAHKGSKSATVKAYEAEGIEGGLNLYLCYTSASRTAFVDYNNEYDRNGNKNEDIISAGVGVRYNLQNQLYGDVVYDPDYDETSGEDKPYYNLFTDFGKDVSTDPTLTQKTDSDGNALYELKKQEVLDENGDPVIDPVTGKVQTEYVTEQKTDENGNLVYDKDGKPVMVNVYDYDSPIMNDPKGSNKYRPYRECEYVGYKIYYVEGVYTKWEDLPAQSEWKEGCNDQNETGKQHIYTTTILQIQWKDDADFLFRVYDSTDHLSYAMDKSLKSWYWDTNGNPCNKGENVLINEGDPETDSENYFAIFLKPATEEDDDGNKMFYLSTCVLAKTYMSLATISPYINTLLSLIKSLLK